MVVDYNSIFFYLCVVFLIWRILWYGIKRVILGFLPTLKIGCICLRSRYVVVTCVNRGKSLNCVKNSFLQLGDD